MSRKMNFFQKSEKDEKKLKWGFSLAARDNVSWLENESVEYPVYASCWEEILADTNNRNIAITGNHGVGKTSLLYTYENKHHQKYLHISLGCINKPIKDEKQPATASGTASGSSNNPITGDKKETSLPNDTSDEVMELEYELLRQITARFHRQMIPHTSVELVPEYHSPIHMLLCVAVPLVVCCILLLSFPSQAASAIKWFYTFQSGLQQSFLNSNLFELFKHIGAYKLNLLTIGILLHAVSVLAFWIVSTSGKKSGTKIVFGIFVICLILGWVTKCYSIIFVLSSSGGIVACIYQKKYQPVEYENFFTGKTALIISQCCFVSIIFIFFAKKLAVQELTDLDLESLADQIVGLAFLLLFITSGILVFCIAYYILPQVKLKELSIGKDENNIKVGTHGIGWLDAFECELIHVIEMIAPHIGSVIVFEDLDRLNPGAAIHICTKLRELNNIINDRAKIEFGFFPFPSVPLRFVYTTSDQFIGQLNEYTIYTKFFDTVFPFYPLESHDDIISVWEKAIPNIFDISSQNRSPKNIFPLFFWVLKKAKEKNVICLVDYRVITQVKNESRLLDNLEKEKRKSASKDNLSLTDLNRIQQKILLFVLYKVLFPEDYYKIRLGKSWLVKKYKNWNTTYLQLTPQQQSTPQQEDAAKYALVKALYQNDPEGKEVFDIIYSSIPSFMGKIV